MKKFLLVLLGLVWVVSFVSAEPQTKIGDWRGLEYTARPLRDPFESPFELMAVPLVKEEIEEESTIKYGLTNLRVQGMVWGTSMPQIIINDTILRIGEVIEGAEILSIRKEGTYVLHEGNQYILRPTMGVK